MSLTMPESTNVSFELCPAGAHVAKCYRVIDLGTQKVKYDGETKSQRKIYIVWEVPGERMEDARPFSIGKRYTFSSHEKSTLRQHLEAWRSKPFKDSDFGDGGFHVRKLIGVPCMLQIIHTERDGKTYANITSVGAMPKGVVLDSGTENETVFFSLEPDEFDPSVFDSLSERLQETIAASPEYQELVNPGPAQKVEVPIGDSGADDTDIPF